MTRVTRRDFNRLAAGSAVAGSAALAAPAIVRAQGNKLKVGVLLPRSGTQAFIGQSCQLGADIAPGPLREMFGVDIELMNADTETNVEVARSRAEKLINDGAQLLVGPFDSGAAAAIADKYATGVAMISAHGLPTISTAIARRTASRASTLGSNPSTIPAPTEQATTVIE